jgi:hypothetical protein
LGKERENRARQWSSNNSKPLEVIEEMTIINIRPLKEGASR